MSWRLRDPIPWETKEEIIKSAREERARVMREFFPVAFAQASRRLQDWIHHQRRGEGSRDNLGAPSSGNP